MIIPDVNVLVYTYDRSSPYHEKSRAWWEAAVNGGDSIGLPWEVTLGFLRLVTHPRVFVHPIPIKDALAIVDEWFQQPTVSPLDPGSKHWQFVTEFLLRVQVGGKLVADAHLAAIAREFRAELVTNDRDFERFSGISIQNPL